MNRFESNRSIAPGPWVLVAMIVAAAMSRLLPHPPNFSPVEAIALFADRARVVQPTFGIDERSAIAVVRICRSLDGIPLAIELAAARVRSMPVDQIAARLDDRFRLLTGGSRIALQRQQTLRAAMDWSHDLLTDQEQATLRRLAVFC